VEVCWVAVCRAEGPAGVARAVKKGVNLGKQLVKASGRGWLHPGLWTRTRRCWRFYCRRGPRVRFWFSY